MLGVVWMLLMSVISFPMFVAGFLVGLGITFLYDIVDGKRKGHKAAFPTNVPHMIRNLPNDIVLATIFTIELLKANVAVLAAAFGPLEKIKPGIIEMPIDLETDGDIMLLANMITLTPGTITVEVSEDNRMIYIHALDASDPQGVIDGINKAFTSRLKKGERP